MLPLSPIRRFFKIFHPEGIPWPGSILYDRLSTSSLFRYHYEELTKDILSYCKEGSLLDVGTGPGRLFLQLHAQAPVLKLTGVDISPAMVAKARQNMAEAGLPSIDILVANAGALPFPDRHFDVVVSSGTIHHWKDPTTGLNEIHRVLKDGGCALMYDLVSDTPSSNMDEIQKKFGWFKTKLFWLHSFEEPFYTRDHFEELATETKFTVDRSHFVGLLCCLVLRKR